MTTPEPVAPPAHAAWIEVDRGALVHNASVLRRAIPADCRLGLLVKANGYGHGLEMAARAGVEGGADQLIAATLDEALAVRRAGIGAPLMVAYPVAPDHLPDAVAAGLEVSVSGLASVRQALAAWAGQAQAATGGALHLHVEVDTGIGRGGVAPADLAEVLLLIDAAPAVTLVGVWSHLANGRDAAGSGEQARVFEAALSAVAALATGDRPMPRRHLVATEGLFAATAPAYEMVRIGLAFYGELGLDFTPAPTLAGLAAELRPTMSVKARPVRLELMAAGATVGYGREWTAERPSLVATLPIGYADGWTRSYWPGSYALYRGRRVPLVGRVSMDSVCVDVTDVAAEGEPRMDEQYVLLGAQGEERITVNDLARRRGTIPNEVLTSFGARLARIER